MKESSTVMDFGGPLSCTGVRSCRSRREMGSVKQAGLMQYVGHMVVTARGALSLHWGWGFLPVKTRNGKCHSSRFDAVRHMVMKPA